MIRIHHILVAVCITSIMHTMYFWTSGEWTGCCSIHLWVSLCVSSTVSTVGLGLTETSGTYRWTFHVEKIMTVTWVRDCTCSSCLTSPPSASAPLKEHWTEMSLSFLYTSYRASCSAWIHVSEDLWSLEILFVYCLFYYIIRILTDQMMIQIHELNTIPHSLSHSQLFPLPLKYQFTLQSTLFDMFHCFNDFSTTWRLR